ncbi:hybrid sensor histidine kinase/response regulator transcription factor [Chryseobacterium sp. 18068]|uniref:hybrid sensor histidine kinase/response regulator transcription factor n=1 Tax=Chryseobacterium sp. 18068 TaxID=2681414 RepID=UPI001357C6FC|nr:hybrid sensor histidine kinase/response regulator transcription factor [Chryseobacterium sp. 18068]
MLKLNFFLFFSLFGLQIFFSQNIRHLSVDEGLPQSFISALEQDDEGFVWIGTRNGLSRYDGRNFTTFQHHFNDRNSLASNTVDYLRKGKENGLWIKYESAGIDYLDINSGKISHIINKAFLEKNNIDIHRKSWLLTQDGYLWFKTMKNELFSFDIQRKTLSRRNLNFNSDEIIYNILEDKNKNIWVLTQKNLKIFDKKTNSFTNIAIPYTMFANKLQQNNIEAALFHQRKNGELMWADRERFYFFDPVKKTFRNEKLPFSSIYNIKLLSTDFQGKEYFVADNIIYNYDKVLGFRKTTVLNLEKNRTPQAFLIDNSGLMWIGGDAEGIYTVDPKLNFKSFHFEKDFAADLLKNYYGISLNNFFNWQELNGILPASYFLRSATAQNKNWIALDRVVSYYDHLQKKIFRLPELPKIKEGSFAPIKGISLYDELPIVIDELNNIYLFQQTKWKLLFSLNNFNSNIKPTDIYFDRKTKILWVTTESHGIIKVNLDIRKIDNIKNNTKTFPVNHLISLVPDRKNDDVLWIGSNDGLIQYNKKNNKVKIFSGKEGFPDNVIYSIIPDKLGNLWMGTNKGLLKFNPTTYKLRIFTRSHGLENIEFNRFHQLMLPDGKMAFGGVKSGVVFNPEDIKNDNFSPPTAITRIALNNERVDLAERNLNPVNQIKELSVDYFENTISISFAALQYNEPQQIQYRYRLKGYQDEWIFAANNTEAIFTKLPPGNYVFQVNATNTTGNWSNLIKSLTIKVTPPWWKTWWAITLYLMVLIGGVFWFVRFKINQEIIKNSIKLKQKEAQELRRLDKIKTKFFANIAHEFRTPLSLIVGPAEQLKSVESQHEKEILFGTIKKNTNSLIQLTDQLIDVAKLEAGVLKPHFVWGDVVPVISNIVNAFLETASEKKIALSLESPEKAEFLFSINTLDRILYNLISNSIKFCESGDTVTVKVDKKNNGLSIQVIDSGAGIPENEQSEIFERYFKGSNQDQLQGNGLGLSLVKELVDLHHGTIDMKSSTQNPSGTVFSVWLPFESQKDQWTEKAERQENSGEKATILIVEDHKELAQFIAGNLAESYHVLTAENGNEALEITLEKMPNLIVSDVAMSEMNGFEFCKALKSDVNINHIPIIMLTAKADAKSKLEGLSLGANDYVVKPFSIEELRLRIENLLNLQNKQYEYFQKQLLQPETNIAPENKQPDSTDKLHKEFLNKIYEIINENLDDSNFSVDELASELSMSRTSLHRKVKMMFNIPTGEIIKIYRLKKAAELLKQNYSISEVAYMTGFNSPSYFTKCFKEYFGKTPNTYH